MNLERRADDEQQPRAPSELERALDLGRRQKLAEEHHVGLEDLAAGGASRCLRLSQEPEYALEPIAPAAGRTAGGPDRAVHLDDLGAARPLVQPIDVLRHD